MRKWLVFGTLFCGSLLSTDAWAWLGGGHMQIAAAAYERLTPAAHEKVDALIKLNPEYANWIAGIPAAKAAQYAFVHAATWAEDIRRAEGYSDADKPTDADAGRNIGYDDKLRHRYWHYMDISFSTDGVPVPLPDPVNALTQIKALTAGLAGVFRSSRQRSLLRLGVASSFGRRCTSTFACDGEIFT